MSRPRLASMLAVATTAAVGATPGTGAGDHRARTPDAEIFAASTGSSPSTT